MKEESLLLLSDLQKLINQVVLIDYTIIILGDDFMPNIKPISDLRNYTDVLKEVDLENQKIIVHLIKGLVD